jgi:hypothetical protein
MFIIKGKTYLQALGYIIFACYLFVAIFQTFRRHRLILSFVDGIIFVILCGYDFGLYMMILKYILISLSFI